MTDKPKKTPRNSVSKNGIIDVLLQRQAVALLITGKNTRQVAEALGVTWNTAKKIIGDKVTQDMLKEIGDATLSTARTLVRTRMVRIADDMMDVLEHHIRKERSLEAVKVGLKVLGVMEQEVAAPLGSGTINVILPGQEAPKTIEAEVADAGYDLPEETGETA